MQATRPSGVDLPEFRGELGRGGADVGGGAAHLGDPGYDDRALLPRGLELQL